MNTDYNRPLKDDEVLQGIIEEEMSRRLRVWWEHELPSVTEVAQSVLEKTRRSRVLPRILSMGHQPTSEEPKITPAASQAVATGSLSVEAQFWTLVADLARWQRAMCAGNRAFVSLYPTLGFWNVWNDMRKGRIIAPKQRAYWPRLLATAQMLDAEKIHWRSAALPRGAGPYWPPAKLKALCHHVLVRQDLLGLSHNKLCETYARFLGSRANFNDMLTQSKPLDSVAEWTGKLEAFCALVPAPGLTLPV